VFSFPVPEGLSPPIVNLDAAAVGYGGPPVLSRLSLRIDQDDRIALLGRNGEGKSTLSKLLAGKLQAAEGRVTASSKLRIGYFAQHQVDELARGRNPASAPPPRTARGSAAEAPRAAGGLRPDGGTGGDGGREAFGWAEGAAVASSGHARRAASC
jgi:ABC-type phosphonate transport system ATPase subunit